MAIVARIGKDGRKSFTVVPEKKVNGKRVRTGCRTFHDEQEAKDYEILQKADEIRGVASQQSKATVKDIALDWLAQKEEELKPSTFYSYGVKVKKYFIPALGHMLIQDVRKAHLSDYLLHLRDENGKPFSRKTVGHHRTIIYGVLQRAEDKGLITVNPAQHIAIPRNAKKEVKRQAYSKDVVIQFLGAVAKLPIATLVILCLYHGLRRGEACGLRWEHVDWEKGTLNIVVQRTVVNGKCIEGPPKADSIRTHFLTDRSAAILTAEMERQAKNKSILGSRYHDLGYVIARVDGLPYSPNSRSNEIRKLWKRLGLSPLIIHGLRHTYASVNYKAGLPLLNLMRALGHKEVRTTFNYISRLEDDEAVEASHMDSWVGDKGNTAFM